MKARKDRKKGYLCRVSWCGECENDEHCWKARITVQFKMIFSALNIDGETVEKKRRLKEGMNERYLYEGPFFALTVRSI